MQAKHLISASIISGLAILSTPSQASSEKQISCELIQVIAQDIMTTRQSGAAMQAAEQRLTDIGSYPSINKIVAGYLQDAYKVPMQLNPEHKQKTISMFGKQAYHQCQAHWSGKDATSTYKPF